MAAILLYRIYELVDESYILRLLVGIYIINISLNRYIIVTYPTINQSIVMTSLIPPLAHHCFVHFPCLASLSSENEDSA